MKVLYISNRAGVNISETLTWFQPYCEVHDLFLHRSLSTAKDFLETKILKAQKHLDFIITDWSFQGENAKALLNWIRNSTFTYSAKSFQFSSVPVLLIEDKINQSSVISEGFDRVVTGFPTDIYALSAAVKSSIKSWRYLLANDLDLIGLDPKTQKNYSGHRANFISYYRLKVLSREFVDNKSKRLNYIWTNPEHNVLQDANQLFYDKMQRTLKNPPKYLEKEIHQFMLNHPTFVKGEDFSYLGKDMLYEQHFPYRDGTLRRDVPDFVNKPYEYALRHPEVFEIKRQSQKLFRHRSETFASRARMSFEQVIRYKRYMTSTRPEHQQFIKEHLGEVYESFEYTLLMGSSLEKMENEDLLNRLKCDFKFEDINLLTYEELLDRHIRLCDRLRNFSIF